MGADDDTSRSSQLADAILPSDATLLADAVAAPSGLPRIVDEGEIARGGMSSVRRVRDTHVRRRVAMKVLLRNDPRAAVHFAREAQILAQLDHPNMPPVYDIGVTAEGVPCFTMKLVTGKTLTQVLGGRPVRAAPELERILEVVLKVCDGVAFAHSRGVVHRDLKPDNVMIAGYGQVYVMDWGCARLLPDEELGAMPGAELEARVRCDAVAELDGAGFIVGTGAYMAPEQARGQTENVGARADVFSLGAILYQVLSGRPPYLGQTVASYLELAREARVTPLGELDPGLSPGLCRIVSRALAADPEARQQTVEELARDLRTFLSGGALLESQRHPAGEVIVAQGDVARAAYIITAGHCEVYRTEGGRKVRLRELGPGQVFGEAGMIAARPRLASVAALDDVTVTVVPAEAFADAMSMSSWTGKFVRALAERFHEADEAVAELRQNAATAPRDGGR